MSIFVDTSGIYALLSATDENHADASSYWARASDVAFTTHAYVVSESIALVRARLGWSGVREFIVDLLPRLDVQMVDRGLHGAALVIYLVEQGGTGFVDRVSIEFARRLGITQAFGFDRDLVSAGLAFPQVQGGAE